MRRQNAEPVSIAKGTAKRAILIVEDDADTRAMFARAFDAADYHVVCADSVEGALRILRAGECFDAVLSDYDLGDGTGTAMFHQAANEGLLDLDAIPTIICTGYSYVEPPHGVVILHKPICPKRLCREVSEMLSEVDERLTA